MAEVARKPRNLHEYISWLVREWQAEIPERLHEIDTEPDSVLGSPRLDGRFRAYLHGSDLATDHDDRLDATMAGSARLRPIHAAIRLLAGRDWDPMSDSGYMASFLWGLACSGGDWETTCDMRGVSPPQTYASYTEYALRRLWAIWARDAVDTAREVGSAG